MIAPSSPFPEDDFERGLAWLGGRYDVSLGTSVRARDGYLAGGDAARLADLDAALTDDVDAIVAARGGYGATRLLEHVSLDAVRPRLLVGFSDVTALHALWARAGLRSLHASMVTGLGRAGEEERRWWLDAVEGEAPKSIEGLTPIAAGVAEGPLVGGNLALLCALLGTAWAPRLEGAVVFVEDVGEAPYRVDRMLTQLRHHGLARAAGVIVGELTRCAPGRDGREVSHVVRDRLGDLGVPVAQGLVAGHGPVNRPLPLGAPVRLRSDDGRLELLEGATSVR